MAEESFAALMLQAAEQAIAEGSTSPYDYFNRAGALAGLGRHAEAVRDYDRVAAVDPRYGEDDGTPGVVWYNRGNSLSALRRFDEAVASYERCLTECGDADPEFTAAVSTNAGFALLRLRRYDRALALFERAVADDPHDPQYPRNLTVARVRARLGRLLGFGRRGR